MTYDGNSLILSAGAVSAAAIDAWFRARGPEAARNFAPDRAYQPAPADLGQIIVEECRRWAPRVVNHDLIAADIAHESAFWQSAIVREKHNPSGLGAVNDNPFGGAVTFQTPREGVRATVAHMLSYAAGEGPWAGNDPRYAAVKSAGWLGVAPRLRDLNGRWAYPGTTYGQQIASAANALVSFANDGSWPMPTTTPTVALAAGHHNTSGGNADEHAQTGLLTPAIAAALRARGVNVRVITPDDGRGDYPGTLSDVARQVRATDVVFLEVHTEGVSNPNVRGVFAIYPDWGGDVDTDVRDTLGPAIVTAVSAATGLPVRGTGLMSEKATGVGAGGDRLGVFRVTEPLKASVTRLIVEYGAHTSPADMAIWNAPGFIDKAAGATADAIAAFLGVQTPREPQVQEPDPNAQHFPQTDKWIVNQTGAAMLTAWRNKGGVAVCGYPLAGMTLDGDGVYRQLFENLMIEIYPDGLVRFGGLGQRYVAALARIAELEAA